MPIAIDPAGYIVYDAGEPIRRSRSRKRVFFRTHYHLSTNPIAIFADKSAANRVLAAVRRRYARLSAEAKEGPKGFWRVHYERCFIRPVEIAEPTREQIRDLEER